MKYGVLVHKYSHNIGDDIQSYATSLFLPNVDYMIDREELDTFKSNNNELVALIMNAWFLWEKWNWPPAKCIIPKLTGLHIASWGIDSLGSPIYDEFIDGIGGEWLKAYGPVGCRDNNTLKVVKKHDIDAYLSGCATLTLPKQEKTENEREYICLVDLPYLVERKIKKIAKRRKLEVKVITHQLDYDSDKLTWNERKEKVEEFLKVYQNAKCVITIRLHAALPCLAMETPVLCIREDIKENDRFSPYNDFLYCTTSEDFLKGRYKYDIFNPPKNKENYLEMRNNIIKDIKEFVDYTQDNSIESENYIKIKYTEDEKMKWQNQLMKYTLNKWIYDNRAYTEELKKQSVDYKLKRPIKEFIKKFLG